MSPPADRSATAVARWIAALPADVYDLRLVPAGGGPVERRRLDAAGLVRVLPWIRARNANGWHCYARPAATRHVLVDDLSCEALEAVRRQHRPSAVVATSPGSHQLWLTVSEAEIDLGHAAAVARLLARRFGGDPGAANAVQLGRLPTTTNRKPRHLRDGRYPYVVIRHAEAVVDPAGALLLAAVAGEVRVAKPTLPHAMPDVRSTAEHAAGLERLSAALPPGALDRSRADFAIARRQLARRADPAQVVAVLLAGERARSLPAAEALAYARRTVGAALRAGR